MNGNERQQLAAAYVETCLEELLRKGMEYAVDGDPNGNFKRVAAKSGQTVGQVWSTHFNKHLDAIENFIKEPSRDMAEPIEGRIRDAVNYLIILYTLIVEGQFNTTSKRASERMSRYGGGDGGE